MFRVIEPLVSLLLERVTLYLSKESNQRKTPPAGLPFGFPRHSSWPTGRPWPIHPTKGAYLDKPKGAPCRQMSQHVGCNSVAYCTNWVRRITGTAKVEYLGKPQGDSCRSMLQPWLIRGQYTYFYQRNRYTVPVLEGRPVGRGSFGQPSIPGFRCAASGLRGREARAPGAAFFWLLFFRC